MQTLPNEIYYAIASYLSDEDLHNYRLANKALARIGAGELFRVLKFHASVRSIERLTRISELEQLRHLVKALVWDTNLWDLNVHTLDDWRDIFGGLRGGSTMGQWQRHTGLSYGDARILLDREIDEKYAEYRERRRDEKEALNGPLLPENLSTTFARLPSLRKVHILNGHITVRRGAVDKHNHYYWKPSYPQLYTRGEHVYRLDLEDGPVGVLAFHRVMKVLQQLGKRDWKLRIDELDHLGFRPHSYPAELSRCGEHITSFVVKISGRKAVVDPELDYSYHSDELRETFRGGLFRSMLRGMKSLRSLNVELPKRDTEYPVCSASSIRDMIPLDMHWPYLRKLVLKEFDTSQDDIIQLLDTHSLTLEKLHLESMCLEPAGSWIQIFQALRTFLNLKDACFKDYFSDHYDEDTSLTWWMDGELGPSLTDYLVNGGNECPLTTTNTCWDGVCPDGKPWMRSDEVGDEDED